MSNSSFSERFESAWRCPTPAGLAELLTEDVVLKQPHLPPIRGKAAVLREFERLFTWLPGTYSQVTNWREDPEMAFIEHCLHFPVGSGVIRIPAVDRFTLKDGLATERQVYFDQMLLVAAVLKRPSLWPGFVRYRSGRGRDGA